jgi:Zn-dependent metalloprotease
MSPVRLLRYAIVAALGAALLPWSTEVMQGQAVPADRTAVIPSLAEAGESLAIKSTAKNTGFVTFASSSGRGILVPQGESAPAVERALGFVDLYGGAFGLSDRSQVRQMRAPQIDELGREHVRFQQTHNGIPVTAGEFIVHLKGSRVTAANGTIVRDLPANVVPGITAGDAQQAARHLIAKYRPAIAATAQYSEPRLEIFNKGVFEPGVYPSRLAWFVEASDLDLRQYIWVDAQSEAILLQFSQIAPALSRSVYTLNNTANPLPGTFVRGEGSAASGNVDADNAYLYAGVTYTYYFTNHGRDSYNGAGAALISTVDACQPAQTCPMQNAFWNGTQMVYGDTYASADDVVGHELTHAVTEYSAHLLYYNQSGALNESFSDIFGETIDQLSSTGGGNDTVGAKWLMGEDLPIGAIRNMMDPTVFDDPGKMGDSAQFKCSTEAWTDQFADRGGVHSNSGVPNHAYALMVDGGSYNGQTIAGIGFTKAAKIEYRALTTYLTSGSGFLDDFNALNQACTDLIGTVGITATDCTNVNKALLAVQMNSAWPCPGAIAPPPICPTGSPTFAFQDGFEAATGNWTAANGSGTWTAFDVDFAKGGTHQAYGSDPNSTSDHKLQMANNVLVPAGGRAYFDSAFEFENSIGVNYDGGRLEYSINSGASWIDANSLIDGGRSYNGTISASDGSAIAGQSAFVSSTYGYTATRLNLGSLAGQNIRFRFRIVSDAGVASFGWTIDNFGIYACTTGTAPVVTAHPSNQTVTAGQSASFSASASGSPTPTVQWQVSSGAGFSNIAGATATTYSFVTTLADNGKQYRAVFTNSVSSATTNPATLTVNSVPTVGSLSITVAGLPAGVSGPVNVTGPGGFNNTYTIMTGTGVNLSDVSAGSYTVTPANVTSGGTYTAPVQTPTVTAGNTTTVNVVYTLAGGGKPGDYDGDGKADMPIYKPSGDWTILKSSTAFVASLVKNWGGAGYTAVPGDYDGDGKQDLALYRGATGDWLILKSSTNFTTTIGVNFGGAGYVPMPGDYDGDGKADIALYRQSTGQWLILKSSTNYVAALYVNWGGAGYTPVPGQDFDGDHASDIALYQQSTGQWLILKSSTAFAAVLGISFGGPGYTLVPGDYDNDGKADAALYQRSTGQWLVLKSGGGSINTGWGGAGYDPVPGDYDGDGKFDLAIVQRSTGNWSILKSTTAFASALSVTGWGAASDTIVTTSIAVGGSDLTRASDFDGDSRSEITVYNTSSGMWISLTSTTGYVGGAYRSWGGSGYMPVAGDFDGDGKTDYGIYQQSSGNWYVLLSGAGFTTSLSKSAGGTGWAPVQADFDGDGKTDFAAYNTSTGLWYGLKSSTGYTAFAVSWGGTGYTPVKGDWDGDGKADLGIYQSSTGYWLVLLSSTNYTTSLFKSLGGAGYAPSPVFP